MYDEVVSVRIDAKSIEEIDRLIDEGDFSTRGEFVKYAVRQTLKRYSGRSPPPLVMGRDGAPPAGRRRILPSVV